MALPAVYPEDVFLDKECYTEEEYFSLEERSQARWEFLPEASARSGGLRMGRIRAMSGGTINHGAIGMNLGNALSNALRGAGNQICRAFGSDVKIHTADGRNTFPDVSVVCGKPDLYWARRDILTNPIVVAEVLSPSTEAYDRSDKWASYQSIPTLQHYLLLAADRVRVEMYTREAAGWHFEVWEDLTAQIPLSGLGVILAVADLYALVDFNE